MKSRAISTGFGRNVAKILAVTALAVLPAQAQDAARNSILQNKADQQDVRQHTAALAAQIQGLIDELGENGISGDDIKTLQTTKAVLNGLSAEEMSRVIASLQKAGEASGTKAGEQNIVDAYAGQKGIVLEFRQILKDYAQREAADELPAKFNELTDRQTQLMWTTAQVATETAGKSQSELNTMQQTTSQIVQADQNALVNDVAMAKQMLERAAPNSAGDQGRAMQQAQQDLQSGKLQDALDKANADLAAGHLLQAATEQKTARDQLRQLAKDLNPPTTTADAMADFSATLTKLIEEQKDLLSQTNAAVGVKPRPTGLDNKEGMLVDQANSLQEDMQALNPAPAGLVKDAMTPMQLARAQLGSRGGNLTAAASGEQDALDKLEEAAKQLDQQVADAQKAAAAAAKDSTAKLQDLQQQLQQAMQQQQQVAQQAAQANGATPPDQNALAAAQQQQNQLQQQAAAMQQAAAPLSLPAAQALANAANAMTQAQQALANPANAQAAQTAQQAAQQALQQANQAVGQQIAQNQQQPSNPSQLANAANDLQQAQTAVSSAIADANPPASAPAPSSPPTMAQAQAALAQANQAAQAAAAVPGLPEAAAAAVQAAEKSIAQGQQAAGQGNAPATAAAAAQAQSALAQAQAGVAMAQAGMSPGPAMAGGPPAPGGPPMPGAPPSPPGPDMPSTVGAQDLAGGSTDKGTLHGASGDGKFISVMSRDRAAITETQGENRPQEYAPQIDQYMKNLADQSSSQ